MYYVGMSVCDISTHYEMLGIDVNYSSVYRWITSYTIIIKKYLDEIVPLVGNQVRADEIWVKVNGSRIIYLHQWMMTYVIG